MMKKLLYQIIPCIFLFAEVNAQCTGSETAGLKPLPGGATDKLLSYDIKHSFSLMPGGAVSPMINLISYNHSFVKETAATCKDSMIIPSIQPPGYKALAKDTMIGEDILNSGVVVNYKTTFVPASGIAFVDSAYSYNCVSAANAITCINVFPYGIGTPVSGVIRTYGFGQPIKPPATSQAYAISLGDVTAIGGKLLRSGTIVWDPLLGSYTTGKSHIIRQKAGTHDPITYFVHDYVSGLDFTGTLLTISMDFYTSNDTIAFTNYWKNDTVHIESDTADFFINYPSPGLTSQNGTLHVKIDGGLVTLATGTGSFSSVALPSPGSPTPVIFQLPNHFLFNYNLGSFNNDSLLVKINMYGYNMNHDLPSSDPISITDSVTSPACNGAKTGAISLTVAGGFKPYTYLWSDGKTSKNRVNLKAKTYTVTVTDSNGGTASETIIVNQPDKIQITITKTKVKCFGGSTGSATATVSEGLPPYQYSWDSGDTDYKITGKPAGTYIVTVTDANGCTKTKSVTIKENPLLTLMVNPESLSTATAVALGGAPDYNFIWFTMPEQTTATATGLVPGQSYIVRVTDSKGCSRIITYNHHFPRMANVEDEYFNVLLMPNPTDGMVSVQIEKPVSDKYTFKLYDLTGRLLFQKEIISSDNKFDFDFREFPKNVYSFSTMNGTELKIVRMIIK